MSQPTVPYIYPYNSVADGPIKSWNWKSSKVEILLTAYN